MFSKFNVHCHFREVPDFSKNENVPDKTEEHDPSLLTQIQSYNPMYSQYFGTEEKDSISLNHEYRVYDWNHIVSQKDPKDVKPFNFHVKYAPLIDPIHYLIGKYDNVQHLLKHLPGDELCIGKMKSHQNCSYVDCFFNFLSSKMFEEHNVVNGIRFFGSYCAIQKRFKIDVSDDYDYLQESEYFQKHKDKIYTMDTLEGSILKLCDGTTQKNRKQLNISETAIDLEIVDLDDTTEEMQTSLDGNESMEVVIFDPNDAVVDASVSSDSDSDSDGSTICHSSSEEEEEEDSESDASKSDSDKETSDGDDSVEDWTDASSSECEMDLFAYIHDFPIQMIFLEKCDGTLDSLLEEESLKDHEIISALMQIIFTLIIYQNAFQFTHNDLHTNNIVYVSTKHKHIVYKYKSKTYRVPTYGKVYKIIDFGRSIYKYENQIICSDSFAPGGDAHGQYNSEPYFDDRKRRLEPNLSFDLCRLGCSIYDFVVDNDCDHLVNTQSIVKEWCTDDFENNILYKKNGDERYPNFKLYKMISRTVHKHTPHNQLNNPIFSSFLCEKYRKSGSDPVIWIDKIPKYTE